MATLARPSVDTSYVTEILEVAHKILRCNQDHELASKITVLEGYLELSRMNPDRSHDDGIRKALDDLMALLHSHLQGQIAEMNRKSLHPMTVEAHTLDMSALELARALLRKGQTLEALPLIEQAMPQYPEEASELMSEAEVQIQAIDQVINRAVADESSSALKLAKQAARRVAQIGASLVGANIRLNRTT